MSPEDTVRRLFAAYPARDRDTVEALLAADFTFTSPLDDCIDLAAYFDRCWPNSETLRTFTLETVCAEGDVVFVRYLAERNDGKQFRNTEVFRVRGDQIIEVDVYFGRTVRDAREVLRPDEPIGRPAPDDETQMKAWFFG